MTQQERQDKVVAATVLLERALEAYGRARIQPTPEAAFERIEHAFRQVVMANKLFAEVLASELEGQLHAL